jgi:hypothetical protein
MRSHRDSDEHRRFPANNLRSLKSAVQIGFTAKEMCAAYAVEFMMILLMNREI